jgi:hypothetical protein
VSVDIDYTPQPKQMLLHQCAANEILYGGSAGPGKAMPLDTPVLTPFGFRKLGELTEGCAITNPDGSVGKVVLVHPVSTHQAQHVYFSDGTSTVCSEEHLWQAHKSGRSRKIKNKRTFAQNEVVTTKTIKSWLDKGFNVLTETNMAVPFNRQCRWWKHDVDPYLLGVLLGDGHLGHKQISITSIDDMSTVLDSLGIEYSIHNKSKTEALAYTFTGKSRIEYIEKITELNLYGCKAAEKFIPDFYKYGAIDQRYEIICGLMDTDGTVDQNGYISFCTTSPKLAEDVAFVLRSLGSVVTISEKEPFYRNDDGEKIYCNKAYNLHIRHRNPEQLFTLKRKKERTRVNTGCVNKRITQIVAGDPVEMRCITVSNPNGLYIVNDFIVTHNSHALRMEGLIWCLRVPGLQVYLFRRTFPELEKNHILPSRTFFPEDVCSYKTRDRRWEFDNGSMLHFCHCQYEADVFQYQGAEIHLLLIDELTTFTEFQYDFLRSRVRCALRIPKKWRHKIPGIVCGSNPGGVGHQFVKKRWVDYLVPYKISKAPNKEGGMRRCYIPGLLGDNKILMETDPEYIHRLDALPEPYRTAYMDGDWDIFMGQAFMLSNKNHIIEPIPIPDNAPVYMTFDWGFGAPFSVGWWWLDADGRLYRFDEWYGWNGEINKGLRLEDSKIAVGIKKREYSQQVEKYQRQVRYAGHDCFSKKPDYNGGGQGKSTAEVFAEHGLYLTKGDANRDLKIRQFRERLKIPDDGTRPMVQIYSTCVNFIRTVGSLQSDQKKVEDIDTTGEDHQYDEACHIFMARPIGMQANSVKVESLAEMRIRMLEKGDLSSQYERDIREDIHRGYMEDVYSDFGDEYSVVKDFADTV